MINLKKPLCFCKKATPIFGYKGEKATHCKSCKSDTMIDVKNKKMYMW